MRNCISPTFNWQPDIQMINLSSSIILNIVNTCIYISHILSNFFFSDNVEWSSDRAVNCKQVSPIPNNQVTNMKKNALNYHIHWQCHAGIGDLFKCEILKERHISEAFEGNLLINTLYSCFLGKRWNMTGSAWSMPSLGMMPNHFRIVFLVPHPQIPP